MQGIRESMMRIADILRDSFNELIITGYLIMNKLFDVRVRPDTAINEAEVLSSMFRDTAVLMDSPGFLNSLGSLSTVKVRGSLVVFVYDIHDIRPFCELIGVPCLEPWDGDSLVTAIKEGRDYSESFEVPYIIRLGPWLNIDEGTKGIGVRRRESTFNKNWGEPIRWGLNRLLSDLRKDIPKEVSARSQDSIVIVGNGDNVLVSGSSWPLIKDMTGKLAGFTLVRSLYVNPLPKDLIKAKYVIDIDDFLANRLGVGRIMIDEVDRWRNELLEKLTQELFFRRAGDPLMLIEWLLTKQRSPSEIPIVILDPTYAHIIDDNKLKGSYDIIPTYFEPYDFDQVVDIVTNPLAGILALIRANYYYGNRIAITNPCTLVQSEELINEIISTIDNNYLLLVVMSDECKDALNLLAKYNVKYKIVNYDENEPLSSLNELLSIKDSWGIVILNIKGSVGKYVYKINNEYCDNCGDCLRIRCPAIYLEKSPTIDTNKCVGCGICQVVCSRGAITRVKIT
ncbi:MAG: indolepyruvate ferredoxin oxidoreductase subunit alpha [Vulcanisaeta sp.]